MTTGQSTRRERSTRTVEVHRGRDVLEVLGRPLDDLLAKSGCPITARRPWLQTWVDHSPRHDPLVVVVRGLDGDLRAAACLAVRAGRGIRHVVAIGDGASDAARLPALDNLDSELLGRGVVQVLDGLGSGWILTARQLDVDDDAVARVAAAAGRSRVSPADASPRLVFGEERSLRAQVSRNHHQQVRRMRNRLSRDGLQVTVQHVRTSDDIQAAWPEIERVCRARDHQLRGVSRLDNPAYACFVRDLVLRLAARDEVRLTTLWLRGRLGAYVLCFQDGSVRRMWNTRLDPGLQDYGLGRLANDAALEDALHDPRCSAFDWMRGEEPYKAAMSNDLHQAVDLTASSHWALLSMAEVTRTVRRSLRDLRDRRGTSGRLLTAAMVAAHHRGRRA